MAVSANRLELLQIADAVAREKAIDRNIVIAAMEDAIQKAARSRYGSETEVRAEINPKTGEIEGIDADLSKELAKELGAELEIVESSFGTFIADLQANKCEIGMFGVGASLKRAQAVEFSKPYLITNIYAVTRKDGPIKSWADIDKKGVKAAVTLGSYIEPFMKSYLKNAELISVAPPNTREGELVAQHVDVIITDYPTAIKVTDEFDWAQTIVPEEKLAVTPYAYVVPQGDQIWLNYVNLFIDTIKLDGRLMKYAKKNKLDPIVAP